MGDSRLDEIAAAYEATRRRTLAVWQQSPTAGEPAPPPYHLTRRAYAIGSLFTAPPPLRALFDEFADTNLGTLSMPPPRLYAVNFDWRLRRQM